jgi:hypothetical protein
MAQIAVSADKRPLDTHVHGGNKRLTFYCVVSGHLLRVSPDPAVLMTVELVYRNTSCSA